MTRHTHLTKAEIATLRANSCSDAATTIVDAVESTVYLARNWGDMSSGIARSQARLLRRCADMIDPAPD